MLLGHVQWVAPEHQVPTHGGMARRVRPAVADGQAFERALPVTMDLVQAPNRRAIDCLRGHAGAKLPVGVVSEGCAK